MDNYIKPDFKNSALINIDVQRDMLDGQPMEIPGTSDALPHIKRLLDTYRTCKLPIIHIVRIYKTDGSNVDLCRRALFEKDVPVLAKDSSGAELARELFDDDVVQLDSKLLLSGEIQKITEGEVIIYKPRWGAFYKTPLQEYLQELKVNTLVFSGCNYPNCPRTSIYEASERDYRIVLAEDALSGCYARGIKEMESIGVFVDTTENIINMVCEQMN
jgi:nicotinamidase-related amidase